MPQIDPMVPNNVDAFKILLAEIKENRKRMRVTSHDPKSVHQEQHGTVMALLVDVMQKVIELRDWTMEVDSEVHARLMSLEEGDLETRILPEHAEKFEDLAKAARHLVGILMKAGQPPEVVTELNRIEALANDCDQIVEDATIDVDMDDGEDEEDEDDDDESDAVGQA